MKHRTAARGAVWRSADGLLYRRTGDAAVQAEADFQLLLAGLGYPVPQITERNVQDGVCSFVEHSAGVSLHEQAMAEADSSGCVGDSLITAALDVSIRLLAAQARDLLPTSRTRLRAWFEQAGFAASVRAENRDLDTARARDAVEHALHRLRDVPMCRSHLDYGLPNAFPAGVIDWQHHGDAPLGYDVYPMLDIAAFKGGTSYRFSAAQRLAYLTGLDEASTRLLGRPLSAHQGDFLLVKCFFFLALMRPADQGRPGKYAKWLYRRVLFELGLEQYEASGMIRSDAFPTLAEFTGRASCPGASAARPGPDGEGPIR